MIHEYIKRTDAIAEINRGDLLVGNNAEWAREIIWRTPYADVKMARYGSWMARRIEFGNYSCNVFNCSECGYGTDKMTRYCPDCGSENLRW